MLPKIKQLAQQQMIYQHEKAHARPIGNRHGKAAARQKIAGKIACHHQQKQSRPRPSRRHINHLAIIG